MLGIDQPTGFGLLQALEPLDLPAIPLGDSRKVRPEAAVVSAGAGGRAHALSGHVLARQPFAGYWEYYLDEALFVEPAHPHWPGAALIGPAGDLIGVGSLRMEQVVEGERSRAAQHVRAGRAAGADPRRPQPRAARRIRPGPGSACSRREISSHVVVYDVSPGGPASRAELKPGDIIHRVAGQTVSELGDFYKRLWALGPPGVVVPLTIQREQDVFDVDIRTTAPPVPAAQAPAELGFIVLLPLREKVPRRS